MRRETLIRPCLKIPHDRLDTIMYANLNMISLEFYIKKHMYVRFVHFRKFQNKFCLEYFHRFAY